jgi:tetratricopeptide (TPR) repeat protein
VDPIAAQLIARLQTDARDRDAYDALKAHYVHGGDLPSLANLLEGWADTQADDWQAASDAYVEAAHAVLQSAGDRERAKLLYRKALARNTLQPAVAEGLRGLLEESGQHRDIVELLDGYANALQKAGGAPADLAVLYRQIGSLWQDALERPDIAQEYFARAERPAHPEPEPEPEPEPDAGVAMPAAVAGDDASQLAHQYAEHAAAEQDPERKAVLLSQLAELHASQLDDLPGAIAALRQALSATPGDVAIMHQLASYLLSRAASGDAESARTDHRRAAELFYQIAQGVDDAQAIAYLESALGSVPDHEGALTLLERVAPEQGAADVLPRHWVDYIASASEGPEVDQRRIALGQAYLRSGQLADAIFCLQPAAEHGHEHANELLQQVFALQAQQGGAGAEATAATQADALPSPQPPRSSSPPRALEDDERARAAADVAALRKQVHEALTARRNEDAAQHCRAILEIDPSDVEAFNLLEGHFRKRRDYPGLRDLLLASTRIPGLTVDTRKQRLREVATLSESKLRDAEAAVSAWRGVATLDPSDREALTNLKRLLTKAQHWDELAAVLEREALATTAASEKAELIREIALVHRDRRKDPVETAEAFRQLHALRPDDVAVRDELCDLLLQLEQWSDAVPLLRERIAAGKDEESKLKWGALLASILHEKLSDFDAAYDACAQLLALRPGDKAAIERMERVDEEGGNFERLLSTLERRVAVAARAERPALYMRMGTVAEQQLHDLDKAAEFFGNALDLAPDDAQALSRLVELFERAQRYDQLVELLRERCLLEKDPKSRALLHRRIAVALAEHLDDADGAAASYRDLLELEEDEGALRFLRDYALHNDDPEQLAHMLQRLAAVVASDAERRDLWFDLAVVQHEKLSQSKPAADALKRILEGADPTFEPAIDLLLAISEAEDDRGGVMLALERRLALLGDPGARLPLAKRLADLSERAPAEPARAIAALLQWARDDAQNPLPRRRLRPLLEAAGDFSTLLATLDELSEWEQDFETRDEARIAAAHVAFERLGDAHGAWRRLLPLVEERNEQAERALQGVARRAGLMPQLAALYVQLAQQSEDPTLQAVYWRCAADVFEDALHDSAQALEAGLRMLATDLGNREYLGYVDRLAIKTKAFRRMSQVYERLLKQTDDAAERVELLKRHADLLENDLQDEALDRVLRACAIAPHDEALLSRAEALAARTRRSEELLAVYDRRRAESADDESRLRLSLRAARLADGALRDRARANAYLKQALVAAGAAAQLGAEVERVARELDRSRPDLGADSVRRALVQAHREVAERSDAAVAARLLLRGAELLHGELADERGAFEVLQKGLALVPKSDELYAALLIAADKHKRLDAVDQLLAQLVDDAIDPATAVVALRRRGSLLEGALGRYQDAAAVYTKLLQLRPDDADATHKLRASLRKSGRHQDLLLALQKQLQRTRDPEQRLLLLKETAATWERGLKNRWEALDAWKAVLRQAPDDADATSAIARLDRQRGSSPSPFDDAPAASESVPAAAAAEPEAPEPGAERSAPSIAGLLAELDLASTSHLAFGTTARSAEPVAEAAPVAEPEDDDAGDLGALEATMHGSHVEEIDAFEDGDSVAIDVELEPAPSPALAASRPPIPVSGASRPLSSAAGASRPLSSAAGASRPLSSAADASRPPLSSAAGASRPPPVPFYGRSTPAPAPAQPQAKPSLPTPGPSTRPSTAPPAPGARASSPPPPLPARNNSRPPPPLPAPRKPE